ncbi:hypothetical protein AAFF_G00175570 [Aldrovandia affinis]|uniref:Multidrug and toxin extrusion protein n=1 Tax=Aldrovandia affinis TaxID=143900 RepID=A0AAD7RLB4_9TELE|nr:hypothetical protein AAFF_G00175570 [Aldrovandia affinis]
MEIKAKTSRSLVTKPTANSWTVCGGCLRHMRSWVPIGYKEEILDVLKLAGPAFLSNVMIFMISIISTVFCGHLGKTELAGVALAISVINVAGVSIGMGLSAACDTLVSQTFGSNNLKRVGVILQRGILILLLACFPCWAILINTEPILLAVRQSPEVARLSQLYVKIFMPALPAVFMYQLEVRYLQNQGIIWPQVITGVAGNVLNALMNYIFLYVLDRGVAGSAAANSISQYSLAVFLFIYINWKGLHKATWGGWSKDCLQEWGSFTQLAIPSMFMTCLDLWVFEIGVLIAGLISEVELGAQSTVFQLANIAYVFPLGFSVAANVRVGNALGAGNTAQAKLSSTVSLLCALVVSFFVAVIIGSLKDVIGYVFTNDKEIVGRVKEVTVLFSLYHLMEATTVVSAGIVRGAGKQKIGALCFLVGYYFIGLPIGVSLMFAAKMGIMGLWTGLIICAVSQSVFFIIFLVKLNWKKATHEALVRAGVQPLPGAEESIEPDCALPKQSQTQALDMELFPRGGTNDLERLSMGESEGGVQEAHTTVGVLLSFKQVVLRRTLTVCVMLLILAAGIVCNILLTAYFN